MATMLQTLVLQTCMLSFVSPTPANYEDAYQDSMDSGKPLLVLVTADWCPACVQLKHNVLPKLQSNGALADVHFAVVDADAEADLADSLTTEDVIPQLLLYRKTADGWKKSTLVGQQSVSSIKTFLGKPTEHTASASMQ